MNIEAVIYQSVLSNGSPVQQLSNLVLNGLSTRADTMNTDSGKLYGSFESGEGEYRLRLYSDVTRADLVASATGAQGVNAVEEENGSGLSGTVYFAQHVSDDNAIEVIAFLSKDSDLPMSNLEGLNDYDDTVGFAAYHLQAFQYLKDYIVSRYKTIIFNPDFITTSQINGGTGGYDLSRCLNLHVLREASAHYAFSRLAEKQAVEDNIFYQRSKESKNLVKAFLTSVELQFDTNNDRVTDRERSFSVWKIARA